MQIHADINIPTNPSNQYIFNNPNNTEIRVKVVTIQSFLWSSLFASNKILLNFLDKNLVYKNKHNLTSIVTTQTITKNQEKSNLYPYIKEIKELYKSFKEIPIIDKLINNENIYSALP